MILAGPGGAGKTTASRRLEPPWHSLCDDTTLLVRDPRGTCWAHPWPTWSDFILDRQRGTWDVERPVLLAGIFFLVPSEDDRTTPIAHAQAVCLLNESAEQASRVMLHRMAEQEARRQRLRRFDNVCLLAQTIPCSFLHLTADGLFWHKIERAIADHGTDVH